MAWSVLPLAAEAVRAHGTGRCRRGAPVFFRRPAGRAGRLLRRERHLLTFLTMQLESRLSKPPALSFALTTSDATPNSRQPPQLSGHVSRRGVPRALYRLASRCSTREGGDDSPTQSPVDRGLRRTRARTRDTWPQRDRAQLARLLPGPRHIW